MITRRFLAQHPTARFMLCSSRIAQPLTHDGAGYTAEEIYQVLQSELSYLMQSKRRRVARVCHEWWVLDGNEVMTRLWIAVMPVAHEAHDGPAQE